MAKVTIRDVAKESGVSISLVSFVMNNSGPRANGKKYAVNADTSRRIREVAERLGYRPSKAAASLRSGRIYTIGVVVSDIANRFFADIARHIEKTAHDSNYTVLFGSSDENAEKLDNVVDTFINNGVEGMIIAPCASSCHAIRRAVNANIPIVLLDRNIVEDLEVSRVMLDNDLAGRMAVEHLYEGGYRKIEMISYTLGISSLTEREQGYKAAMSERGLSQNVKVHYTTYGNVRDEVRRMTADAVARGVEALILPTNTLSVYCLEAISDLDIKVPKTLAVLCFDDSEVYDILRPTITHITQSTRDLGVQSFAQLENLIEEKSNNRNIILRPELIIGGSTASTCTNRMMCKKEEATIADMTPINSLLLCGSTFADTGGWTIDQQFVELMGSTYLLAHGLGHPVSDAVTQMKIPTTGDYHIFVRTKNWTALWTDYDSPGLFSLIIDGVEYNTHYGIGAIPGSNEWYWQRGETIHLEKGQHIVALHDLTGFEGRCDSILFSQIDMQLDSSVKTIYKLRHNLLRLPGKPNDKGVFDLVVVGGGVAGMCAALSAARLGLKVALIQDRIVLGGNNSSEVRVGLGGRINIGEYPSLGYLLNEFGPSKKGNARPAFTYEDEKKMEIIRHEKRIKLFIGYRVDEVIKNDNRILESVLATEIKTYQRIRVHGRLFTDCTGDAVLGVLAGAEWRMGREASSTFGEPSAPKMADNLTMGASVQWYAEEKETPQTFPDIKWGLSIDERSVQKVHRGQWYWEVGMRDDQIMDAERIRDYGMYVAYSNWAYLKNRSSVRKDYKNSQIEWLSYIAGKRESRRIMGEFVLCEKDLTNFVKYPDGTVSTSWYIDQHVPDPENSRLFPKQEYLSCGLLTPLNFYPIPYRCFYSKDLDNLFMAGRNISVSHIALGTVRVMRTTAMMGEVVGMAAAICIRNNATPHEVYASHFEDLKTLMHKGVGRTDVPYMQIYTLIDTTAARSEDC